MFGVLAVLALLWLFIAVAMAVIAARRFRLAQQVLDAAQANARLLALTPARPLLVRADGTVEADSQLVRDLGLEQKPASLSDLAGNDSGITPADLDALVADIELAQTTAVTVSRTVHANGSARVFDVRGGPATDEKPGTLLLWFFDTSAGEEERAKLSLRLGQTEGALNSLTQLIEAAPFPMWYRGPDLKLGLVNSAFVHAVEGSDAADVIERGAELIDAQGDESGAAKAREAREKGASSPRCSRRSSAANAECCRWSTFRCRPALWPALPSMCRILKTRGLSLRVTSNRSVSSLTG